MATSSGSRMESVSCEDFAMFQDVLRQLRLIDDRIVSALNCSLPTASFKALQNSEQQCKEFSEQLSQVHEDRKKLIKRCVTEVANSVATLRQQREKSEDQVLNMNLRNEQKKLRQMQAELNVEEIVRDRTLKVFYERCRLIYLPPDFRLS